MNQHDPANAFTRRDFLLGGTTLSALALLAAPRLAAAEAGGFRQAPYLALEKFIAPGDGEFPGEKRAAEVRERLHAALQSGRLPLAAGATGSSPCAKEYVRVADDLEEAHFDGDDSGIEAGWQRWVKSLGEIRRAEFYVLPGDAIRFEVASHKDERLWYRVGMWRQVWDSAELREFRPVSEQVCAARTPWFRDVTGHALSESQTLPEQFLHGVPYWRARLDPASGIDIYGSNGIAVGDLDGDGVDEVYVCQPGGLPNRLLKFRSDGTLIDITEHWGVGLLDDTSCALFLDLRNTGKQDLIVLRSAGPVLYLHEGDRYRLRDDAFRFANLPKGGFTGMAAADFDRDGKLDLYLCCYVYFQSEAQYTYAAPYHDARNGPPNFLFRNSLNADGSGFFLDCTGETGMGDNNDRFSFAPAWCDYNEDGWPDLYVANDFGRKNLYCNQHGKFRDVAAEAGVEDIGPGMSAAWFDFDRDGRPDLYVANMWTAAGQRVIADGNFKPAQSAPEAYRGHTMGNSLFRNRGDGTFQNATEQQRAGFGRWAWSSGGHDLDNDGNPEIVVTCGMLTNSSETDLNSFFWRQVVSRSPSTATPSAAYENGWNALNQFVREEYSWSGHEPNVMHARRGERYFDFSGISGLDFAEDSRAFAVTDFDGDGRPDILLKSRLGPQLRVLQNNCTGERHAIAFRLRGTKSNRDGIGARVRVDGQTKWLDAGSGFLSQHSKRLLFGIGTTAVAARVSILWPSGAAQEFLNLQPGRTYLVVEGEAETTSQPFRELQPMPSVPVVANNALRLHDTWLMEPVPLPTSEHGPGLFVIRDATPEYEIFRRYLFDWRTSLQPPLALLLNAEGEAVKVYASFPTQAQVDSDLQTLKSGAKVKALPFEGEYIKQPSRDFFKFGAAYLWAGYPEVSLPYLKKVLQHSPDNARVIVLLAQIHLQASRVEEAEKLFRRSLELDPKSVNALIGLGDIFARAEQQQQASSYYSEALALDPNSAEAANGLGLALAKQGRLDEGRQYLERAITIRRDYADAVNNLAVLYTQQGKLNDAIAAWRYGIQVAPEDDILYLNLGRAYIRMGQSDKARLVMQDLLDKKPDNAIARRALQELDRR